MQEPGARSELVPSGLPWTPRAPLPEPPFLVAGLGRAGRSAVRVLRDIFGPELVSAWDADTNAGMQRVRRDLEANGIRTSLAPRVNRREVDFARTVVKSPGIAFSSQIIDRARSRGRLVIDELELGWRLTRTPVLAVTGTNGKSTVSGLATPRCARRAGALNSRATPSSATRCRRRRRARWTGSSARRRATSSRGA